MKKRIIYIFRIVGAGICFTLGLIGLVLPIFPGGVLIVLGVILAFPGKEKTILEKIKKFKDDLVRRLRS